MGIDGNYKAAVINILNWNEISTNSNNLMLHSNKIDGTMSNNNKDITDKSC